MTYIFNKMTQEQAENIAFNWHYDGEYSFYNMEADKEDLDEFINPETRGNSMFAVTKNEELIAFLGIEKAANETCDIGLGMRPDLTGKGKGMGFLKAAIDFVIAEYKPKKITLSVATFNQRAIKIYRRIGFKEIAFFDQETNSSTYEFLKMEYAC
jgi:[ribosomal protein S18]-alanine N-acetyltransferase